VAEVLLSGVIQSAGGINADDAIELLQEAFIMFSFKLYSCSHLLESRV
jgi:hypothetical protein